MTTTTATERSRFRPLQDGLLVEKLTTERLPSGLFVPNGDPHKGTWVGRVLAVGPGRDEATCTTCRAKKGPTKGRVPMTVKVGDLVLFGQYAGGQIRLDGRDYHYAKEQDALGILEDATTNGETTT